MARKCNLGPRQPVAWVPRPTWKPYNESRIRRRGALSCVRQQPPTQVPKRGRKGGACRRTCGYMAPQLPTHMGGVCTWVNGQLTP